MSLQFVIAHILVGGTHDDKLGVSIDRCFPDDQAELKKVFEVAAAAFVTEFSKGRTALRLEQNERADREDNPVDKVIADLPKTENFTTKTVS
jgi:hypothetical protein